MHFPLLSSGCAIAQFFVRYSTWHATVPSQSETEMRGCGCSAATVPGESETRDEAVGAVVQHATVPSESEMRDEAMGAVAQRATVPRECESEIEQRLWASASWVITTRASFWVCRCRRPRLARRVNRFTPAC